MCAIVAHRSTQRDGVDCAVRKLVLAELGITREEIDNYKEP
jgi:hypothetical protein